MSLTNPNKVVTESRLSEFYTDILPYLGGMPDVLANKFDKSSMYSISEKMIGQWTDGKPLYQKVIVDTLPVVSVDGETASKQISVGASIDMGFIKNAYYQSTYKNYNSLLFVSSAMNRIVSAVLYPNDGTNIQNAITVNTNGITYSEKPVYFIVCYTKTTDSAVSIGNDTDYSTTEKIVGTWVDGKPIYQKTFVDTLPTPEAESVYASKDISIGASVADGFIVSATTVSAAGNIFALPLNVNDSANTSIYVRINSNTSATPNAINVSNNRTTWGGRPCTITIRYTKTTD